MRVFVIGAGRTGSKTFAMAHEGTVTNYTTGHETRVGIIDPWKRLSYPDQHIEVDHRLAFYLPQIWEIEDRDPVAPPSSIIVHLRRRHDATARSWAKRFNVKGGMMRAWRQTIAFRPETAGSEEAVADNYVHFINFAIERIMEEDAIVPCIPIDIEAPYHGLYELWNTAGMEGDFVLCMKLILENRLGKSS